MASKLFMSGKQLTGAVANALKINCKDKDGNKSTVQDELNKLYEVGQNENFEEIDISNLITPVTGVTLNNLEAKRYGKDVYITAYAEWTASAKSTRLFNIDESLVPITPVLSSCFIETGSGYYFGYVSITNLLASAVIGTSTSALRLNLHWRIS